MIKEEKNPVLLTDYEHKVYLLKNEKRKATELFDVIRNSLQLSNIKKSEIPLYSLKIDMIEEYMNMGMFDIANDHLFEIVARLNLNKSVSGFGVVSQLGDINAKVTMKQDDMADVQLNQETVEERDRKPLNLAEKLRSFSRSANSRGV